MEVSIIFPPFFTLSYPHGTVPYCQGKIDDIISRNRLPIIVGGSFYYLQAVLWGLDNGGNLDREAIIREGGLIKPATSIKNGPNFSKIREIVLKTDPTMYTEDEIKDYFRHNNVYDYLMELDPSE